jgi:hypothetical protein
MASVYVISDRYLKISAEHTAIYMPHAFYYWDVGMFYVTIEGRKAYIFAVQITIAYDHADSRERLLKYWHKLTPSLGAFDVWLSFVWITESGSQPVEKVSAQQAASGSRRL